PSIAVDVEGGVQLAYYFEGDQVPVRRVIYQRRLPGREFHGVALPLTNTLNKETGWWAQPPVAISIDENAVASVAYFLAGPDHYLQAAYWKPGMPTAIRIAETAQPTQSPEIQIAAGGARANAIFRMAGEDGAAATWLAGGANGGEWAAPLRLPSNAAEGTVAVDVNASGDYAYAISGAPSFVLLRERAGIPVPLPLAAPDAHATQRISLALDDERRLTLAYVDAQDGSLMIYRAALPWD
ncbi:MAG TPA: hypothetical protein VHE37_11580, partial [Nevskiaceae bacterium]|nr:hypothetical protein [Nevskiaceae bacterium]